ncbi:hypothetical protein O5O45_06940 [Hahella aquimaris]|uniref:hypothetical protein n=1 Tax=Hahella sp. HNIBRBA332 TaxID=3015983 RepID=UPI00273B78A8|nr:hypothetical protein [Hahella sp. HNIBRBA332]WLQ15651.1 hypothetical protein O5O45_06940 [Hahella sp. HNIBRBA332]
MSQEMIGALSIDLRLATAKIEDGLKSVNTHLERTASAANNAGKMFSVLTTIATAGVFGGVIKGSLDAANHLGDLSVRLGVSVEGLSRLAYAAELSGVSAGTLETGLQRMTRRIAEAAAGSGEAIGAIKALGLSAQKLQQLRPEQQFEVLADALAEVPAKSDRVRLAMKLLDSEGVALLQTMEGGSAAIRAMGEESDRIGNTISTSFATQATAANAAIIKMNAALTGMTNNMAVALGPTIEQVAHFMGDVLPEAAKLGGQAVRLLAAGALEVSASVIEFIRVGTYYLGKLSDDVAKVDAELYAMQENLRGATGDIFAEMEGANRETEKFKVTLGESVVTLQDYQGVTATVADNLQRVKAAQEEANAALQRQNEIRGNVESIRESLLTEEEAERESYERRRDMLQEALDESLLTQTQHMELLGELSAQHQATLTAIEEREKGKRKALAEAEHQERVSVMTGMLGNLSTLMDTKSKKLFEIGKKAAIANALVSGYEAAVHSYNKGAQIGGPIVGAAFAATSVVATAVQIQKLKSQKFGGGGTVSAGGGGAPPNTYQPPQPTIPSGPASGKGEGAQIIFQFNGPVNGDPYLIADAIAPHLRDIVSKKDIVIVEANSRNGQQLRGL